MRLVAAGARAQRPSMVKMQSVTVTERCIIDSILGSVLLRWQVMHRRSRSLVCDRILPVQHQTLWQKCVEADTNIKNLLDESEPDVELAHDELQLHADLHLGQDVIIKDKVLGRLLAKVDLVWSGNIAVRVIDDRGAENDGAHGFHVAGLALCLEQFLPEVLLLSGRTVYRDDLVNLLLGRHDSDLGGIILSDELLQLVVLGGGHSGEAKDDQLCERIQLLSNEAWLQFIPSRLSDLLGLGLRLVELMYTTIAEHIAGRGIERVWNSPDEVVTMTQLCGGDLTNRSGGIDLGSVFRADVVLENIVQKVADEIGSLGVVNIRTLIASRIGFRDEA